MVQLNVWTGTKWVNIFDGNDFKNMSIDQHRVAKVVDDQVVQIKDAVKRADDAVEQAGKAVDSSNVNKAAIDAANSAIAEAKQSASDAVQKLQSVESSVNTTSDEVTEVKQSQADQIKQVTNQISDAVTQAKAATDSLDAKTTALQTAVKNAQSDATVAIQTASEANVTAINATSDAATAKITASGAAVTATNAQSDVVAIQATASAATITAGNAASDALTAKATASSANLTATNAKNDVAQISATADSLSTRVTAVESKATANSTVIDENAKAITLKADQTTVDALNKTVTDNSAAVNVLNGEITSKVDSTTVNKIVDGKGFATTNTVQSLVDQKASKISQTIADVKTTVDGNGNAISTANDKISNLTQTIDGIQATVKDKADQSRITLLSNALQVKLSGSIIAQATDVTLTYTGKENEYPPAAPLAGMNDVDKGSTLILSFDYVASDDTKLIPQLDGDPWVPWGTIVNATPAAKGKKGSYSMTITVNDDSWQKGNAKNLCIRCDSFKGTIEITNLVLKYADTTLNDVQSSFDMLRDDINLRVTKGDLLSQINIAAGHTLIQSNKIYLDADSVVFGENSTAFIPSAYITDINADKITTGILNSIAINNGDGAFTVNPSGDVVANSITVRNGNIFQGQIIGTGFYAINRTTDTENEVTKFTSLDQVDDSIDEWFKINGRIVEWHDGDNYASIGPAMPLVQGTGSDVKEMMTDGLTLVGTNGVTISAGSKAYPGKVSSDYYIHQKQNISWALPTNITVKDDEIRVNLNSDSGNVTDNKGAAFSIQKDNKVGAYFGIGDEGKRTEITSFGGFHLMNTGIYAEDPKVTSTISNLNVDNLHVKTWFGADGYKNSTVKTSQGLVGINAYETAEYYFGDIGESNTGSNGQVIIGIDHIFNETVNTDIQYQVFVTPYSDAHVWVEERYNNRFVICSDKPDAEFGWEIKAKRKGYERTRLQNFDNVMPQVKRSK